MAAIRLTFLTILLGLLQAGQGLAADWTLFKHQGRDYVPFEDISAFYGLTTISRVSNEMTISSANRSLRGCARSSDLTINGVKFILSYPIEEINGRLLVSRMDLTKLIEPVMRPSRIRNAERIETIILDPGHGGHDNGATCSLGSEKDFTLDVARRTKALLTESGFRVLMTRSSDVFVPLEERARIANRYSNALFISIHFNAGQNAGASGVETYTLAPRGVPSMAADGPRLSDLQPCAGNRRDAENMALATATHASLVRQSKLFDRGIKRARFVVIRDITIPGVLIEGGFLTSAHDRRVVATPIYRQTMAAAIADAVGNYRRAVNSEPQTQLAAGKSVELRPISGAANQPNEPTVIAPSRN